MDRIVSKIQYLKTWPIPASLMILFKINFQAVKVKNYLTILVLGPFPKKQEWESKFLKRNRFIYFIKTANDWSVKPLGMGIGSALIS